LFLAVLAALWMARASSLAAPAPSKPETAPAEQPSPGELKAEKAGAEPDDPASELNRFKDDVSQYQLLVWKADQARERRDELSRQLKQSKGDAPSEFFRDFRLESLQTQLHATIAEIGELEKQKAQRLESLGKNAARYQAALRRIIEAAEKSLSRQNEGEKSSGQIAVDARELDRLREIIEKLASDPKAAESLLRNAPGEPSRNESPSQRRQNIASAIQRMEQEQEALLKRYVQNQASIRRLRLLEEADGEAPRDLAAQLESTGPGALPAPALRPGAALFEARVVGGSAPNSTQTP